MGTIVGIPQGITDRQRHREDIDHECHRIHAMLDAGADLSFVRDWLGHVNIQNTIVYQYPDAAVS